MTKRARWSPKRIKKGQPHPKDLAKPDIREKFNTKLEENFGNCNSTQGENQNPTNMER